MKLLSGFRVGVFFSKEIRMNNIEYIYEDNDILVCHKPAGVATEGARSYSMDVVSAARNYISRQNRGKNTGKNADRKPPYVATVHRLDQPVEGVIILAKNKKAATDIASQIKKRTTDKYYYALCYGVFQDKKGTLENLLVRKEDGFAAVVTEKESESLDGNTITLESGESIKIMSGDIKKAKLEYEVIAETKEKSLLRIKLFTGRFHQIRVQMAHIGHPILGDQRYGTQESIDYSVENAIKDICLVSYKFALNHPVSRKRIEFEITPNNPQIKAMLDNTK